MYVITTIVYLSMTNLLFHFFKLTNCARVIYFLTNTGSVHCLLFLVTAFSPIFNNKEILIRFLQHFNLYCYFFERVRLKNCVNILSIIAIVADGVL